MGYAEDDRDGLLSPATLTDRKYPMAAFERGGQLEGERYEHVGRDEEDRHIGFESARGYAPVPGVLNDDGTSIASVAGSRRPHSVHSAHHQHQHQHHRKKTFRRKQKTTSRVTKPIRRLPFLRKPTRDLDEVWLKEEDRATPWMGLFYDLVVVAVLGVFSKSHELRAVEAIPVFFSYYVIIVGLWTSQVHYDVRYEGEDMFHRIFKAFQIVIFVYIGASSGGWNPGKMIGLVDVAKSDDEALRQLLHDQAAESFLTVVLAFAFNRFLTTLQYLVVIWSGRRVGRPTLGPWMSAVACIVSCGFSFVAAWVPVPTDELKYSKIACLYTGIFLEFVGMGLQHWWVDTPVPVEEIAERYGALTLIILGEGFLGLCYSFSKTIASLSYVHKTVYGQVFLVIIVMLNLWGFLFSNFHHKDHIGANRTTFWELVHFPLHFGMLLLLASLVNVVVADSFDSGLVSLNENMGTLYQLTFNMVTLPDEVLNTLNLFFNRLDPGFITSLEGIKEMHNSSNTFSAETYFWKYCAGLVTKLCDKAGVDISEASTQTYNSIKTLSYTDATNSTTIDEAAKGLKLLVAGVADDAFSGTRWLFPVAGGVLMLCAVRSAIRYEFEGIAGTTMHGAQLVAGFGLAMIGLLDIGDKQYMHYSEEGYLVPNPNVNGMYKLVSWHMAVAVVFLVYSGVTFFTYGFLAIWHRCHSKVFHD